MLEQERVAAGSLIVSCLVGAACSAWTAVDLGLYLASAPSATGLSNPFQREKLAALTFLFGILAILLSMAAWRSAQRPAIQRMVISTWSPLTIVSVSGVALYLGLVYYPLPSHRHHLDKLLLVLGMVLAWTLWFLIQPLALAGIGESLAYRWIRLVAINALVFIIAGETVLRVADPLLARGGLFGDADTPASLRPHTEVVGSIGRSNSHGFRDRERVFQRNGAGPRIVAIGDSFTWGAGVSYDQTFVTLLERSLQARHPGAEVINLGVPGFEPEHEFHLLQRYGIKFQPDLVMLNFYVGNDIMRKRGADFEDAIVVAGRSYYVHRNGNWVHDHLGPDRSYLYHNLNYLVRVGDMRVRSWLGQPESQVWDFGQSGAVPAASSITSPLIWDPLYLKNIDERSEVFLTEDTELFLFHWNHTCATLAALVEWLKAQQIPLVLVLIPDQIQVDRALQRAFLEATGALPNRYDFEKPQRLLRAWADAAGIAIIDLLEWFKHQEASARLYIPNDTHWTEAGHALAAEVILPNLERQLAQLNRGDPLLSRPATLSHSNSQ